MNRIFVLVFSVVFSVSALAQSDSADCRVNKEYVKSYFSDGFKLIKSPAKWKKNDLFFTGAVMSSATLAYVYDREISDYFEKRQNKTLTDLNTYFFDPYGKMIYTIPIMGGFYIYGHFADSRKERAVAMDLVKASFYSGVIALGVKHAAHRARPYQTSPKNPYKYSGPFENFDNTSLFSMHTASAFSFAAVISQHYPSKKLLAATLYSIATLEGLSRIYIQKHYASDVIIGAAIGYAVGRFVVKNNFCNFSINPIVSNNYSGLLINYNIK
jgi:membrane-associated phospholipid phosphatase